jgi:hypothetical protein
MLARNLGGTIFVAFLEGPISADKSQNAQITIFVVLLEANRYPPTPSRHTPGTEDQRSDGQREP